MTHDTAGAGSAAASDEFVLLRWRRYGKDHLYVARSDGSKVGYWDMLTDEGHPDAPELRDLLAATVAASDCPGHHASGSALRADLTGPGVSVSMISLPSPVVGSDLRRLDSAD
jgi:hypothetical protein